jgi:hypothetical protein
MFDLFLGTSRACQRQSEAKRSQDLGPFLGPFWGWDYVKGMGCWPMGLPMFRPIVVMYNRRLGHVIKQKCI